MSHESQSQTISWDDFEKVDFRLGTITRAEINEKARKPAYKLWVDCGDELGIKTSSAQITQHYTVDELIGKRVICVVNFEPMRIAGFKSEILVTGFHDENGHVILSTIDKEPLKNGVKLA